MSFTKALPSLTALALGAACLVSAMTAGSGAADARWRCWGCGAFAAGAIAGAAIARPYYPPRYYYPRPVVYPAPYPACPLYGPLPWYCR